MEADYKNVTKPARSVGNFFKKLTGKKVEEEPAPSKNRVILDKLVAKERRKKENERVEKRSQFHLWLQDKLSFFAPKNAPIAEEDLNDEQIPVHIEEEILLDFDEEL